MNRLRLLFILLATLATFGTGCAVDEGWTPRECSDGLDNDFDGGIDCDDPGCCGTWVCGVRCEGGADDDDSSGGS